jgi:hypothetical protein
MTLAEYLRLQMVEALGDENRWYCSQYYQREITDHEILFRYYIQHGGAKNFAERFGDKLDKAA